jgi:nitrate reductase NapE component
MHLTSTTTRLRSRCLTAHHNPLRCFLFLRQCIFLLVAIIYLAVYNFLSLSYDVIFTKKTTTEPPNVFLTSILSTTATIGVVDLGTRIGWTGGNMAL